MKKEPLRFCSGSFTFCEQCTNNRLNFRATIKVYLVGNVGQYVFACVNNVKETNDAIRWCNTHKVGDKFDKNLYSIEIISE